MQHTTIAVDLAKSVFQVAVSHHTGRVDEEHRLTRAPETGHRTGERTAQQHGGFPLITTRDVLVYPSSRRVCSMAST